MPNIKARRHVFTCEAHSFLSFFLCNPSLLSSFLCDPPFRRLPLRDSYFFVMAALNPQTTLVYQNEENVCSGFKNDCKVEFEALESFLRKDGLTYKGVLKKLIKRTSLKKAVSQQVINYIKWMMTNTKRVLFVIYRIEYWDEEVIKMISDVVNSLKDVEDEELDIPVVAAICVLCQRYFSELEDKTSRVDILKTIKRLAWDLCVDLNCCDEIVDHWATAPSKVVDTVWARKQRIGPSGIHA